MRKNKPTEKKKEERKYQERVEIKMDFAETMKRIIRIRPPKKA